MSTSGKMMMTIEGMMMPRGKDGSSLSRVPLALGAVALVVLARLRVVGVVIVIIAREEARRFDWDLGILFFFFFVVVFFCEQSFRRWPGRSSICSQDLRMIEDR